MNVLLTVPSLESGFGGPAAKALHLSDSLRKRSLRVELVGCGRANGATGLPVLTRVHATPVPRRFKEIRLGTSRADIVHVLGYRDPVGTAAALAAGRQQKPFVIELEGMYGAKLRSHRMKKLFEQVIGSRVIRSARIVIANSRIEANELVELGIAEDRIVVRANGVHTEDLLPLPPRGMLRKKFQIPLEVPIVLFLGRITALKAVHRMVDALKYLPEAWALIAGPDERDGSIELIRQIGEKAGVATRVRLVIGGLWGPERAAAFSDADCFCLPSIFDSFGIAALEAAAVGLPVVASSTCGVVEFLRPSARVVVRNGQTGQLAEALSRALSEAEIRTAAVQDAPRVRSEFSWDAMAAAQQDIYGTALA